MNNHKDAGRNIARIDYDCLNNPVRIQFTNGNVTKYIYSTIGEKLRVVYQTAVPNITVAIGSSRELAPSEIQCTDTTVIMVSYNPLIDPIPIRIMILISVSLAIAHIVWYAIANNLLIANC